MKASKFIEEWGMWKGLGIELDKKYISKEQHQAELRELRKVIIEKLDIIIKIKKELSDLKKEYNEALENTADRNYQIGLEQGKKKLEDLKELVEVTKEVKNKKIEELKKALVTSEDKLLECAENNYNEGFIEGCKKLKERGAVK